MSTEIYAHEIYADTYTLDTTWQFQLLASDGGWNWYSQAEYRTEQGCHEAAQAVYGGGMTYRLIRHDRVVVA